ncbi:RidA family protein [Burkholderia multivorans]|nr:hypothetical protein [Burkholderia multivorans]
MHRSSDRPVLLPRSCEAGTALTNAVKTTVVLTGLGDFDRVDEIYADFCC